MRSPGKVDVSCNGPQDGQGTVRLEAVWPDLIDAPSRDQGGRRASGIERGRLHDRCRGQTRQGLDNCRCVGRDVALKGLEAVAPCVDERPVVELFRDDYVEEAERERAVGAGPYRKPAGGKGGRFRPAGIDHDQRGIASAIFLDGAPEERVVRFSRVYAPENGARRLFEVELVIEGPAKRYCVGPDVRVPADLPYAHVVRTAEEVHEAMERPVCGVRPAYGRRQRLRPVLLFQPGEPRCNLVEGLVPRDALPSA